MQELRVRLPEAPLGIDGLRGASFPVFQFAKPYVMET